MKTAEAFSVRVPAAARRLLEPLARRARAEGLALYAVGGCVRDWLRGGSTNDYDLVCDRDPAPLLAWCRRAAGGRAEAFGQFGTFRVVGAGRPPLRIDLAVARRERYPAPASLPVVAPAASIEEDLGRRDFTVNAMALAFNGPRRGELIDPFGGRADLRAKRLRLLHASSLRDDPTRAFRAARYACRLGLRPDADLLRQCREAMAAGHAARLSPHRLTQELLRLLAERETRCPLAYLERWGYLALFGVRPPSPPRELRGVEERLCAMVLALGSRGKAFVDRLALERRLSGDLHELLRLTEEKRAARERLPIHVLRALRALRPGLPACALRPLFLNGSDLEALGLVPGPGFRRVLERAAALQWRGTLRRRSEALAWARRHAARLLEHGGADGAARNMVR